MNIPTNIPTNLKTDINTQETNFCKQVRNKNVTVYEKNIQLSEKLEYLMTHGNLQVIDDGKKIRMIYLSSDKDIIEVKSGMRLLEFVNFIVEKYGIYPLIQKYHAR